MDDLISRQAAIDAFEKELSAKYNRRELAIGFVGVESIIRDLPSVQPEQPTGVQDILQYLDEYLHPIVSPDHWSIYSELYDMVSMLPSAQRKGKWTATKEWGGRNYSCSCCKFSFIVDTCMLEPMWNFCPNCGAEMVKGEEDENNNQI